MLTRCAPPLSHCLSLSLDHASLLSLLPLSIIASSLSLPLSLVASFSRCLSLSLPLSLVSLPLSDSRYLSFSRCFCSLSRYLSPSRSLSCCLSHSLPTPLTRLSLSRRCFSLSLSHSSSHLLPLLSLSSHLPPLTSLILPHTCYLSSALPLFPSLPL